MKARTKAPVQEWTPWQEPGQPLIYVASSWKNAGHLDRVHEALRARGLKTWDFRQQGFWWGDVPMEDRRDPWVFLRASASQQAFAFDKQGLDLCAGALVVLPAGVSTAIEAGYAAGAGKPVVVWGRPREDRLDIMWNIAREILPDSEPVEAVAEAMGKAVGR